ncbi:Uncharacterised protein [Candidatus Bilamarchaeum dharawalense]|uniref:Uncharacterized protein n=1 Tax=Candidatus Bilamarchaeum dharawalense TaxID=2885759 RepID=A0A5E4LRM5_9ARCH|nr:Uncharacterised protein [Candidatus Bilamarchaeum dharawalense]
MVNEKELSLKTTIWDLLEIGPISLFPGAGLSSIVKIKEELQPVDIILIRFFFIDELWLIRNGVFNLAIIGMIVTIEDRLRKQILDIPLHNRFEKKDVETMTLNNLIDELEKQTPLLSKNSIDALRRVNEIRKAFIHTNMNKGEELIRKSQNVNAFFLEETAPPSALKHEGIRVNLKYESLDICIKVLMDCLIVLRELQADTIKGSYPSFDQLIQREIQYRKDMTAIDDVYKERFKHGENPKTLLQEIWDKLF